jgi:hypothetical protein
VTAALPATERTPQEVLADMSERAWRALGRHGGYAALPGELAERVVAHLVDVAVGYVRDSPDGSAVLLHWGGLAARLAAEVAAGEWGDTPEGWEAFARTLEGPAVGC